MNFNRHTRAAGDSASTESEPSQVSSGRFRRHLGGDEEPKEAAISAEEQSNAPLVAPKKRRTLIALLILLILLIAFSFVYFNGYLEYLLASGDIDSSGEETLPPVTQSSLSYSDISPSDTVSDSSMYLTSSDVTAPSQTEPSAEASAPISAKVSVSSAVIRSSASSSSAKKGTLPKGTKVTVLSQTEDWCKILYRKDKTGWMYSGCLEFLSTDTVSSSKYKALPSPVSASDLPLSLEGTLAAKKLDEKAKKYNAMGVTLAVIKDGKVTYNYEYGYSNKENNEPMTPDTKIRIASITKVFVTMNAMSLVEKGEMNLDDDLSNVFGFNVRNPRKKNYPITMRMLLTHTSSIHDPNPVFDGTVKKTLKSKDSYMYTNPGKYWSYTNLGFGIAGAAIEKASGMSISDYASSAFFSKMGIDASFDGSKLKDPSHVATCYSGKRVTKSAAYITRKQPELEPGETFHLGAGGLIITSVDMARVLSILINDGIYEDERYLSAESVAEIEKKQFMPKGFAQCLGIRKKSDLIDSRTMFYHTGNAYGVLSLACYDKKTKTGVVVTTTGASTEVDENKVYKVCSSLAETCYKYVINK